MANAEGVTKLLFEPMVNHTMIAHACDQLLSYMLAINGSILNKSMLSFIYAPKIYTGIIL